MKEIGSLSYEDILTAYPTPTGGSSGAAWGIPAGSLGSLAGMLDVARREKIISDIVANGYWIKMTGSRVTKDGWTSDSDWDYVVYDPNQKLQDVYKQQDGWVLGSDADQGEFASIKKDSINLILVDKEEIWKKYIIATNLIKTLNSKTKGERVAVFDSVFGKDSNAKALEF